MANDFKALASGIGANVISQSAYLIALGGGGSLVNGFEAGLAKSDEFNKVFRQATSIAAVLAQLAADTTGLDMLDDGDLAVLQSRFAAMIASIGGANVWSTGDMKITMKAVADSGWLMCEDQTIGDASSGANYANAAAEDLFLLLWANVSNTWAPVLPSRGGSAAGDWAAHKTLNLTKMLGRALGISGAGSGLSSRALGQNLGSETVSLATVNLPAHNHGVTDPGHSHGVNDAGHSHTDLTYNQPGIGNAGGGGARVNPVASNTGVSGTGISIQSAATGISTQNTGSGTAFNIMNPVGYVNVMIKL